MTRFTSAALALSATILIAGAAEAGDNDRERH